MITKSQKLSEFFNIGRDRGWDVEKQCWTVHQLINPEGKIFTLGEILTEYPSTCALKKSGKPVRISAAARSDPKEPTLSGAEGEFAGYVRHAAREFSFAGY